MVDTDNIIFQASKVIEIGDSLPTGLFGDLELCLKQTKNGVDDIDFRLDELGVTCGSASQAYAFKQRVEKMN